MLYRYDVLAMSMQYQTGTVQEQHTLFSFYPLFSSSCIIQAIKCYYWKSLRSHPNFSSHSIDSNSIIPKHGEKVSSGKTLWLILYKTTLMKSHIFLGIILQTPNIRSKFYVFKDKEEKTTENTTTKFSKFQILL